MTQDVHQFIKLPMACRHGGDDLAQCQENRTLVQNWLELPEDYPSFVSAVIMALDADYMITVEAIHADQWFSVRVSKWAKDEEPFPVVRVECDLVEDGLAAIYRWARETYGDPIDD